MGKMSKEAHNNNHHCHICDAKTVARFETDVKIIEGDRYYAYEVTLRIFCTVCDTLVGADEGVL